MLWKTLTETALDPESYLKRYPDFAWHGVAVDMSEQLDCVLYGLKSNAGQHWLPDRVIELVSELRGLMPDAQQQQLYTLDSYVNDPVWGQVRLRAREILDAIRAWVEAVGLRFDEENPEVLFSDPLR